MKFWVALILIFISSIAVYAEENFNREILERLVRMETKIDNQQRQIDDIKSDFGDLKADFKDLRADFKDLRADTDKKFDRLYAFLYWAFGIITSLLFVFSSFILWDRRTVLTPVERKTSEIEAKLSKYEEIFKLMANQRKITPEYLKELGIA